MSIARGLIVGIFASVFTFLQAQTPTAINNPPVESFVGEQFCYTLRFDNPNPNVGYGPYFRLILPPELTLDSAEFLGSPITIQDLGLFPAGPGAEITDPRTGDQVMGDTGDRLLLLILPLGSVVQGGPDLNVDLCVTISTTATVGLPLPISATPVFEFGDTPTGTNGPLVGADNTQTVTPTLVIFSKTHDAPELERPPGPSFPFTYTLNVNIANAQTINSMTISDVLPPEFQYVGPITVTGGTGCMVTSEPSTMTPGGTVTVTCTSDTGTTASDDLVVSFPVHIIDTLDETNCAGKLLTNAATFDGSYLGNPIPQLTDDEPVTAKHIAIQKGVAAPNRIPGNGVTYTVNFQVTDFGTGDALVLTDLMPDGLTFGATTGMTVNGGPVAINEVENHNADGTTTLTWDIVAAAGNLTPGTTGTLTYTASIDQDYEPGPDPVLASDILANTIGGVYDLIEGASNCNEGSGASFVIEPVNISKIIVNPQPEYVPGDVVTFRISLEIPSGDTEQIIFHDFLPLPVFDATSIDTTFGNDITFAPTNTLPGLGTVSITTDGPTNSLRIAWDPVTDVVGETLAVDVDVTVTNDPFADNLFLTNLFQVSTDNSDPDTAIGTTAAMIHVRAPDLVITKGITASTNPTADATLSPASPEDSDITQSDAGDTLTFEITVENQGGAFADNVVVSEDVPAGLTACGGVTVTDGAGNPIPSSGDLFGAGLTITNGLQGNDGTIGAPFSTDTAIITYTCTLDTGVEPREVITNTASVNWRSLSGAVSFPTRTDTADITIAGPAIDKTVDSVVPNGAGMGQITAGDTVTYLYTVTLPEGTTPDLNLSDALPRGMSFVSASVDTTGFGGTVDTNPTVTPSGTVNGGLTLNIAFDSPADTSVTDDNNAGNNSFTVSVVTRVEGTSTANSGEGSTQNKTNTVTLTYTDMSGPPIQDSTTQPFAEPRLVVTKSMTSPVDAGDQVTITVQLRNTGTAPVYDLTITDVLNDDGNVFDTSTVAEGTTPAGFTFGYADPTVTYTGAGPINPGAPALTFTFTVNVDANAVTGSTYSNEVAVSGDTQAGVVAGERTKTDTGSGNITITAVNPTKTINATSEAYTAGNVVAIGEIVTYQLSITIPEGVTAEDGTNALITDRLPLGFQFQTGSATIRVDNAAGGNLVGSNSGAVPTMDTLIAPVVTGTPSTTGELLSFDLGDLTNSENDGDAETLVILYDVLVLNSSDNNRTNQKDNEARLNYDNKDGNPQSQTTSATAFIGEPNLVITKARDKATAIGGETVTFTVVLSNTNNTNVVRAWEPIITDNLPADYTTPMVVSATLSRGAVDLSGCSSFAGNLLTVNPGTCLAANNNFLDPNDTITVVYSAVLSPATPFDKQVINTADGTATSLEGANGNGPAPGAAGSGAGERTGSGGVNDLEDMDNATVTAGSASITKTGDTNLPIGATTTMTLTVSVPVGTTNNFVVTDDLPAGLRYTGTADVMIQAGITATTPADPAADSDPLVFDFQTLTNNSGAVRTITITYEVQITNVVANQNTTNLTNTATLTYQNQIAPDSDTATLTVIEPNLEIGVSITNGTIGKDAGDQVNYQITVENTSTNATAFRVALESLLPPELLGGMGSPFFRNIMMTNPMDAVLINGGGPLAASDAMFSTTTNADDTLTFPFFDLPPNTTLTITFETLITNTAPAGAVLTNNVSASYNSLSAGGGRDGSTMGSDDDLNDMVDLNNYNESGSTPITLAADIAIQKSLTTTGQPDNDFTIGETVSFDLRVDLQEGITDSVVITDQLPVGLVYTAPVVVVADPHISYTGAGTGNDMGGGQIEIDMGNVTNTADGNNMNDFFIVRVVARVEDIPGNTAGDMLTNSASLTSGVGPAGPSTTEIDIIEPNLTVSKVPSDTNPALGDTVTFTITVAHDMSTADAYDIVLTDVIPAGLTYEPGSTVGAAVDESDPTTPVFTLASLALTDGSDNFSFQVRVANDAVVGALITNTIDMDYSGLPGANPNEREYTGDGSGGVTPGTPAVIDAVKTVSISNDLGTMGVVDPGDELLYTVVLNNLGGPVTGTVFNDPIPADTTFVAASLTTSKGTPDESDPTNLVVNVGDMANGEMVTITFRVTVDPGTPAGTIISNQGSVDSNETVPEPTDQDGVDANGDQPTDIPVGGGGDAEIYAEKIVEWFADTDMSGDVNPGDEMRYFFIIRNTGGATLNNVSLTDVIPNGLSYAGTSTISGMGNSVNVVGSNVTASVGSIPIGMSVTVTVHVTIDGPPLFNSDADPNEETFINQGIVDSDEAGPVDTDSNGNPVDGSQPTLFTAVDGAAAEPLLDVEKRWTQHTDPNGDGLVNPLESITYTITVQNIGSAAATNVRLNDTIPADTDIILGSLTTSTGAVITETPNVSVNIGTLNPGALATIRFNVRVKGATPNGTIVPNQAIVSSNELPNEPSDDNGTDGDGKNPTLTPIVAGGGGGVGTPSGLSKTLQSSSESDSTGNNVFIGETVTYRIEANFPAGTLHDVSLIDSLPEGLIYLSDSARLARNFDTGINAAQDPGGINGTASGNFIALADSSDIFITGGRDIVLPLGDVINSDNDADAESYVLEIQALVENIAANQAGGTLSNQGTLSYRNNLNQLQTLTPESVDVDLLEANLQVTKTPDPALILPGGGTTTFTVTITNPDNGTTTGHAYNLSISDSLPAEYTILNVNSIVPSGGVSGVADNSVGTDLSVSVDVFPPNGQLVITYAATAPGPLTPGTLTNTVNVDWTSLPGAQGTGNAAPGAPGSGTGERTADGGVNNLTTSAEADVAVGDISMEKTIVNPLAHYAIGDPVTYQVVITMPGDGVYVNMTLEDILDEGLTYVDGSVNVQYDAGVVSANDPMAFNRTDNSPIAGQETIDLDFGDVTVSSGAISDITVTYQALVDNLLGNQDSVTLDNNATASFGPMGNTVSKSDGTTLTVGEPFLTLAKSITSPIAGLDAGDNVDFSVVVGNTGNTTAFEVVLSDILPAGMENVTNLVVAGTTGGAESPALNNNGDSWAGDGFDVPPGATVTITFTAQLANTVIAGEVVQNQVTASFSSRNGSDPNERNGSTPNSTQTNNSQLNNYNESAMSPTITVADPVQLDKTFYPDPNRDHYTIGEPVRYRLTIALIEGTTNNLVLRDQLPGTMSYVTALVGVGNLGISHNYSHPPDVTADRLVTFDFGSVMNPADGDPSNDFITVDLYARADDVAFNQQDTVLGNHAQVEFEGPGGTVTRDYDNDAVTPGIQPLDLTVIVPVLQVAKTPSKTTASPGDQVSFSLIVDHAADSGMDARDVEVTDTLPDGMAYVDGSANIPPTVNGQELVFQLGVLPLGDSNEITYDVELGQGPLAPSLTNVVDVAYSTLIGDISYERSLATSGDSTITPLVSSIIDATKTVAIVVDNTQPGLLEPGDTIEYTVTLVNTGSAVTNTVFTDTLPPELTYVPGSLTSDTGSVDESNAPDLVVNVGDMADNQIVVITMRGTVNAGVPAGTIISNQGLVDSDQTVPEPTDQDGNDGNGDQPTDIEVAGASNTPGLYVEKSVVRQIDLDGSGNNSPDDTMRYSFTIRNTGDVILTNVSVDDQVPNGLTLLPASGTIDDAGSSIILGTDTVMVDVPELGVGGVVTASFDVTIDNPLFDNDAAPQSETFTNQAAVDSDQTDPSASDGNGDPNDGNQPTEFPAFDGSGSPQLASSKTWGHAIDNDGDGLVDEGDTIRYTITIANTGTGPATDVTFSDTPDTNTSLVAGSVTTSQGSITGGNAGTPPVAVEIGAIPASGDVTITFDVTVNGSLAPGVLQVVNQGFIESNELPTVPTDDPNLPGTEDPTVTPLAQSPVLVVTKSDSVPANPGQPAKPGDIVRYLVTIRNTGGGVATGVSFSDTPDANTSLVAGTITTSQGTVTGGNNGTPPIQVNIGNIAPNGSVTIGFDVTVNNPLPGHVQTVANQGLVQSNELPPQPSDDPATGDPSDPTVTPVQGEPEFQAIKSDSLVDDVDNNGYASPGDIIGYTIAIQNVGNAPATLTLLNDILDPNVSLITGTVTTTQGSVTSGNTAGDGHVSVDFGQIDPGPSITVTFQVRINNPIPAGVMQIVNQGMLFSNELPVKPTDDPELPGPEDPTITPLQAEPVLISSKTDSLAVDADNNGRPSAGDTLEYVVTVRNHGNAAATGIGFRDTPDGNTSLVAGSITTDHGNVLGGNDGTPPVLVNVGTLNPNEEAVIRFRVVIDNPLPAGVTHVANQGIFNSNEVPHTPTDDPELPGPQDPTITPLHPDPEIVVSKTDLLYIDQNQDGLPSPGDTLVYLVHVENLGNGQATDVVFRDIPDTNTSLVPGSVKTNMGFVGSGNDGNPPVIVNIGTLDAGQTADISFHVTINAPLPAEVTRVANQGLVLSNELPAVPSDDPETPEPGDPTITPLNASPQLEALKQDFLLFDNDGDGVASAGDALLYTITVMNTGMGSAENVVFSDTPDVNTPIIPGSVATSQGTITSGMDGTPPVVVELGTLAGNGGVATISFQVQIPANLSPGVVQVVNQGEVNALGLPTVRTDDPTEPGPQDPNVTPLGLNPILSASKTDYLLVDADNNGGASPGDTLIYHVIITNTGNGDATEVMFRDFPDTNTSLVSGSVITDQGTVTGGNNGVPPVIVELGLLPSGGVAHISFHVTVNSPLPAGVTRVVNQGLVSSQEYPTILTDDPEVPGPQDPTPTPLLLEPAINAQKTALLEIDADSDGRPSPGDTLLYQIVINNTGYAEATGVVYEDQPDANTTLVSGSVFSSQGSITSGNVGVGPVRVNVGSIPGYGGQVTISYRTTINNPLPAGTTQLINQGDVSSNELPNVPTDDPTEPGPVDPTIVPLGQLPDLKAYKVDSLYTDRNGDGVASPGDTILYQITIRNQGNAAATNVHFSDTPDVHTSILAGSVKTSQGVITAGNDGTPPIEIQIGTMNPDATVLISFLVDVADPLPVTVSEVVNQGTVTSNELNPVLTDDLAFNGLIDPTPTLVFQADLKIEKSAPAGPITIGDTFTYQLVVTNQGPNSAAPVTVTDVLPVQVSYVSVSSTQGSAEYQAVSRTVVADLGTLAVDGTATVTITVRVEASGTISNTAEVTAPQIDPNPTDNTDTTDTTGGTAGGLDLSLTKRAEPGVVGLGQQATFFIDVINHGSGDATGVVVTDLLPVGLTLLETNATHGGYNSNTGEWQIGVLTEGETATLALVVQVNNDFNGTSISNSASVVANEIESDMTNNQDTAVLQVVAAIPTLQPWALALFAILLALAAMRIKRKQA